MRSDGRLGARRSDAYARRYGGRKRRRGVRPLSGRVPDSRALSGTAAGEVLRRGARIRRRGDVAAAHGSIVLSLPYQRVHPEGECNPEMLERFRIVSDSELAAVEARAGAQEHDGGEWAKLAALKERMEAQEPQEEDRTPEK